MDKLNVGVIGVGAMGKSHVRVYSSIKDVRLIAISDVNQEIGRNIARTYKTNYYKNYRDMLKKERIDAVSICVPTKLHKRVAVDAIKKKINVLVEKPIATNLKEAQEIINEATKNGIKLMVGHIERFNPVVIELKKRIEKYELGKMYKVHCVRLSPFPKRIIDVGVIVDLAIHEIDILNYIIKSKIKRIYAETAQRIHSSNEDLLIGTIKFENGILGVVNANWLTPKKVREITVTGEKGMFVANYLKQELYFYENEFVRRNSDYDSNFMSVIEGNMTKIKIEKKEPLQNELAAFIKSIVNNEYVSVTGYDGLQALFIAQKFIESAKKNKVIAL